MSRTDRDLSIDEAMDEFAADVRRLNQHHQILGWSVAQDGETLHVMCSCDRRSRAIKPGANHFSDIIRALRGPVRKGK